MRLAETLIFLGGMLLAIALVGLDQPQKAGTGPYEATDVRVIDGDTIHVGVLHLGYGVCLTNQKVRAADFDAWEISRQRFGDRTTDEELANGREAAGQLRALLQTGRLHCWPAKQQKDAHGRLLSHWTLVDESGELRIAEWMTARKHTRK